MEMVTEAQDIFSALEDHSLSIEEVYLEAAFYVHTGANHVVLLVLNGYKYNLDTRDTDSWRRLGQAISESISIKSFNCYIENEVADIAPGFTQSLEALYEGLKCNKSLTSFILEYQYVTVGRHFPAFDFSHFLRNNTEIREISLGLWPEMTLDESRAVEDAIRTHGAELSKIGVWSFSKNDECFEQIVSACWEVNTLDVSCQNNHECNVISALLRDPRVKVQELILQGDVNTSEQEMLLLKALTGSTTMRTLNVKGLDMKGSRILHSLVCDISSIKSVYRSNHVLQRIVDLGDDIPESVSYCLEINRMLDRDEIIREKIARLYFTGTFDMQPFLDMPASVLVEVLALIEKGKSTDLNAFFRLLSCRPDLCSFAGTIQIMLKRKLELMNSSDRIQTCQEDNEATIKNNQTIQ